LKKVEKEVIRQIIKEYGDSFWQEDGNENLFDEIVEMLNNAGYDLILTPKPRYICIACAEEYFEKSGIDFPIHSYSLLAKIAALMCRLNEEIDDDIYCNVCPHCFCFFDEKPTEDVCDKEIDIMEVE